jgi:hypothetical protein
MAGELLKTTRTIADVLEGAKRIGESVKLTAEKNSGAMAG